MGCTAEQGSDCSDDEKPAHEVTLSDFEIGVTEVTIEQYLAFCDETKGNYPEWLEQGNSYNIETGTDDYYKKKGMSRENKNHPITGVSWNNAVAYCQWLSKKTGKNYRLPTEAEWEYAARGGNLSKKYKYAGSNTLDEVAWYDNNSNSTTHPVGLKNANELGLYDMSGNVYEWCGDDWHDDYKGAPSNGSAWVDKGSRGSFRVFRGGSWDNSARFCRVSFRFGNSPVYRYGSIGFRVGSSLQ
jgi:formylglycine-generating enzyme required for sulfatase activity